ncbi:MAG: TIM barrel protein [Betaproteobacteria bacterium]
MARFAPNLYHLFVELPARERFAAVAELGFDAVEWHFPYEIPKTELKHLLDDNGLTFTYAVVPADWPNKNYGYAGRPGQEDLFHRAVDQALDYAAHVPFKYLNVGHGMLQPNTDRERSVETYVKNLQYICDQAKGLDLLMVVEPVTSARFKVPFVLSTMAQGAEVHRLVNRDNCKLVFDTYHLRMEETGSLEGVLDEYWPMIGYVQFGNAPTRNEPGVGEIDFDYIIHLLEEKGHKGWIGLEYDPSINSWDSLLWTNPYGYKVKKRDEVTDK